MGKPNRPAPSDGAALVDAGAEDVPVSPATEAAAFKLRLLRPHPLIQSTRQPIDNDRYGYRSRNEPKRIDINVSQPMRKAALVVMDRLIKALESNDLKVDVANDHQGSGTFVSAGRDRVQLRIYEKRRQAEHVPTAKELHDKETYGSRIPKWDQMPTGELVLEPGGVVDLSSDEAIRRLVEKAVADSVEFLAERRKRREAEEAERRREWERQQAAAEHKQRVECMLKAADALHRYKMLMQYIEEVRRFGRVPDDQRREGQTVEEWIAWAEAQAQCIHPLDC